MPLYFSVPAFSALSVAIIPRRMLHTAGILAILVVNACFSSLKMVGIL